MKTLRKDTFLPKTGENVIILDNLEFGFPKGQLEEIREDWEAGIDIEQIKFKQQRPADEIFLALFHLARLGKIKRPFGRRI
ncbi:hypothetical protein [Halobacillus sp. KGW1]|uniref:hypothetical protein n=1 Tax=Halobacillus sp. KGW1 TaxID=1793726 RepID=UPI0007853260|nr:hypothetical protein [Halobacillus sp. KGW1]